MGRSFNGGCVGSHTDDEAATGGTILGSAHIDCQQVVEPPCAHVEEVENGASEQDEAQSRPQAAHQAAPNNQLALIGCKMRMRW